MSRSRFRPRVEPLDDRCLPSFSPAVSYPVGASTQAVVAADLNGDGVTDLATADQGADAVSVLLGAGDGTFAAAPASATGYAPRSLAAGDFDRDGRADLATANYGDVSILLGNGDGTFAPAATVMGDGSFITAVAAGDLDADGRADLVVTSWEGISDGESGASWGAADVLLGYGDGTFASPVRAPAGSGPQSVALADLNGDARPDVVTTDHEARSAVVLLGNGDGTLQPATFVGTDAPWGGGPMFAAVTDFDRDGRPDLATANSDNTVSVLAGNGNGTFGAARTYAGGGNAASLAVADFNADGNPDLAQPSADPSDGSWVGVLLGGGDGTVGPATRHATGSSPAAVVAADFNGDGFADLATANTSATASVLVNDANWPAPGAPALAVTDAAVTEGNAGTTLLTFTVTLSSASDRAVTVNFATADGTATAGGDYAAAAGTLTFAPGETSKTVTVPVSGDRVGEPNEAFAVHLSGATNATIADGEGVGTVLDDEPRVSIGDVSRSEGRRGRTTLFTFTVTLSSAYNQPVTVSFRTVNGTATTGNGDYVAKTGTLTFAPGETTKTVTIAVKGDSKREANETFYLDLFGLSDNALFTKNRGTGTILNDD